MFKKSRESFSKSVAVLAGGDKRLAKKVPIDCFENNPTINSSLKLLRRNQWARKKVETLYLRTRFS